jgi:hypothetical protein
MKNIRGLLWTPLLQKSEALLIRCGPFHQRVMVRTIQEVAPSRNAVSSPISPSRPALAVSELSNM